MSLLDIIEAQKALAIRLKLWGVEVDVKKRADGFIDDLIARGWQMSPDREGRPQPPARHEQCARCGGRLPACACTREHLADDEHPATPEPRPRPASPDTKTAALAAMRAGLRGKEEA